ncbi:diguanylate cyclase (GGDEF)-like protein [Rhodoligotrophos appendicifer]|uniref:GGDEF domain-containing protein n=1 Tax=Rhodoligotrophos appendicifer TaxID=987056 RepID=UPI00117C670F|nr:GGDEF domain-containing protein [Rhodoligotrophos appendicifer]
MRRFSELVTNPIVRDESALLPFVARIMLLAVAIALAADVTNQLIFFSDWQAAIRSWVITVIVAGGIAGPIAYTIGRSHIALWNAKLEVEKLSRTDPLTGLPNRRALLDDLDRTPFAYMILAIIDIDHFKLINDTHGHRIGDYVLKLFADRMSREFEGLGILGRMGGDEFALLVKDGPPQDIYDRLNAFCNRHGPVPLVAEGVAVQVTISVGAAIRTGRSIDSLYTEADRALYKAKASGRNCVSVSDDLASILQSKYEAPPSLAV